MKKTYNKPQIVFESFEINTSIAAGCMYLTDTKSDSNSCSYTDNGVTIFTGENACGMDDTTADAFCQHVPTDAYVIFNS